MSDGVGCNVPSTFDTCPASRLTTRLVPQIWGHLDTDTPENMYHPEICIIYFPSKKGGIIQWNQTPFSLKTVSIFHV